MTAASAYQFAAGGLPLLEDDVPQGAVPLALASQPAAAAAPTAPVAAAQPSRPAPAATGLSAAWAPIPPEELKAAPVGGPPAAWRAAALDLDLHRGGFLHDSQLGSSGGAQSSGSSNATLDPFDPPPSLAPVPRKPPRSREPSAFAVQWTGGPGAEARESRAPQTAQPGMKPAVAIGLVAGRELERNAGAPSPLLRWTLRAGMGLSLFVIATTVGHCRAIETGVDDALARWGPRSGQGLAGDAASTYASKLEPSAITWLASDTNTVSNGDEDRVRGLVQRLDAAGAEDVYIGNITTVGMAQIANELVVDLPSDAKKRRAVLEVYDQFMSATFGGVKVAGAAPTDNKLRITL